MNALVPRCVRDLAAAAVRLMERDPSLVGWDALRRAAGATRAGALSDCAEQAINLYGVTIGAVRGHQLARTDRDMEPETRLMMLRLMAGESVSIA